MADAAPLRLRTAHVEASGTGDLREVMTDEEILDRLQADYDRRRRRLHGRLLLWLLRKTT
jgi:hypothetical protein